MAGFRDSRQRTWAVEITVGTLKRVRELCGVDLLQVLDRDSGLFGRLHDDPVLLVDVLCAVLRPQLAEHGVDDGQFAEALLGPALDDAVQAFLQGLADFFPKAAQRDALRQLVAKSGRLHERLMEVGLEQIAAFDADAVDVAALLASAAATPTAPSGSSPESSASIPPPSASASSSGWPAPASPTPGTAPPT